MTQRLDPWLEDHIPLCELTEDQIDALVDAQTEAMFEAWSFRLLSSLTLNVQRPPLNDPRIAQRCRKTTALPLHFTGFFNTWLFPGGTLLGKERWALPWLPCSDW